MSAAVDFLPLEHPLTADSKFFFLHIPKTAGTTLTTILKQHFGLKNYLRIFEVDLADLPHDYAEAYRYYSGHIDYDLIRTLLPDKMAWVTFLREPAARFLSDFAFTRSIILKSHPDARFWPLVETVAHLYHLDIAEFVNHPDLPTIAQNRQTHMLGNTFNFKNFHEIKATLAYIPNLHSEEFRLLNVNDSVEGLIAQAKQRLTKAAFFGLTERFQDSLHLLAYTFGWQPRPDELRLNVAASPARQADLSAGTLERIRELNRLDLALYSYAQQLFDTRFNRMSHELLERYGRRTHAHLKPPLPTEILTELLDKHYIRRLTQRQSPARFFRLNLDQAVSGTGWYWPEPHPQHGTYHWSGPGRQATLNMLLHPGQPARVIFSIIAAITPEALDNFRLQVNGQPIGLNRYPGQAGAVVFIGYLPAAAKSDGFTRLTFELDRTLSPATLTDSDDERLLGLALSRLEIHPVDSGDSGWGDACRRLLAPAVLERQPHLFRTTDIITPGQGWYPLESYQGETFYWVNNDAEMIIHAPTGQRTHLNLEVEPGPGLSGQPLQLQVLDAAGRVVAVTPKIRGRQMVNVRLPLKPGPATVFQLHVEGGGHITPNDPRLLNFRIFYFEWGLTAQANGETKRWHSLKKIRIPGLPR